MFGESRLFSILISFGVSLIFVLFNPFYGDIYLDSTRSYGFISATKIFLLIVLNLALLIAWSLKIKATGESKLRSSNINYVGILWLLSVVVSGMVLPQNRHLSFWGVNANLENSFVEYLCLATFFLILINNIESIEEVKNIIRGMLLGNSVIFVLNLLNYTNFWSSVFSKDFWLIKFFLGNPFFTPIGHYGSIQVVALISVLLSIGLLYTQIQGGNEDERLVALDSVNFLMNLANLGLVLNLFSQRTNYFFLVFVLLSITALIYFQFRSTRPLTEQVSRNLYLFGIVSFAVGIILNFFSVNMNQPNSSPNLNLTYSWNVVLDEIKTDIFSGVLGRGFGLFSYSFNRYKNQDLAKPFLDSDGRPTLSNFTLSGELPRMEEIRVNQPYSVLLGILLNQGLFGLVVFSVIIGLAIIKLVKAFSYHKDILALSLIISIVYLVINFIFVRYDFILMLVFWIITALSVALSGILSDNDGFTNLVLGFGRGYTFNNFAFVIPAMFSAIFLVLSLVTIKIFPANFFAYQAKVFAYENNKDEYLKYSEQAFNWFPESDLLGRQYVFGLFLNLEEQINPLIKKIRNLKDEDIEKLSQEERREIERSIALVVEEQRKINYIIDYLISINPYEYRNHFLKGLLSARVSELLNFSQDQAALLYFTNALNLNSYHPETHYNRAKIILRNAQNKTDLLSALNEIRTAISYRPYNLSYLFTQADVQRKLAGLLIEENNLDEAESNLKRISEFYSEVKKLRNETPQEFSKALDILYESENVAEDQKEVDMLLEKIQKLRKNSGSNDKDNKKR